MRKAEWCVEEGYSIAGRGGSLKDDRSSLNCTDSDTGTKRQPTKLGRSVEMPARF